MIPDDFLQQQCCTAIANYIRTNQITIPDGFKLPPKYAESICKQLRRRKRLTIDDWLELNKLGCTEINLSGETLSTEDMIKLQNFETPQSVIYRQNTEFGGSPNSGLLFIQLIEDRTQLTALDLSFVEVNDGNRDMVRKLLHSFPNLKKLVLESVNLGNFRLCFEMLRNLIHLNIFETNIQCITGIHKLSKLERLHLGWLDVSDENWREVMKLENLKMLHVERGRRNCIIDIIIETSFDSVNEGRPVPWRNLWFLNLGEGMIDVMETPFAFQNMMKAYPCLRVIFCFGSRLDVGTINKQLIVPPRNVAIVTDPGYINNRQFLEFIQAMEYHQLFPIDELWLTFCTLCGLPDFSDDDNDRIVPTGEDRCKVVKAALDALVANPTSHEANYYILRVFTDLKDGEDWRRCRGIDKQTILDICSQILIALDREPLKGTTDPDGLDGSVTEQACYALSSYQDYFVEELGAWKVFKLIFMKLSSETLEDNLLGIYVDPPSTAKYNEVCLIDVLHTYACLLPEDVIVDPEFLKKVTSFLIPRIEKDIRTPDDHRNSWIMASIIGSMSKRTTDWSWFESVGVPRLRALLGVRLRADMEIRELLQSKPAAAITHNS